MSFFSTTCHKSMLRGIYKWINPFLMQIESLIFFIREVLNIMNMYKSIKWGGNNVVKIWIELDLCYPAFMNLFFDIVKAMLFLLVADGLFGTDYWWRFILQLIIAWLFNMFVLLFLLIFMHLVYLLVELLFNFMLMTPVL